MSPESELGTLLAAYRDRRAAHGDPTFDGPTDCRGCGRPLPDHPDARDPRFCPDCAVLVVKGVYPWQPAELT